MIDIIDVGLKFSNIMSQRPSTDKIVIHHADMTGSVEDIHKLHLKQGWAGIGYHYYVRQDGKVYRGRPEDKQGAHCINSNNSSVGVCFEGRYDTIATMPNAQMEAGKELIKYLRDKYPHAKLYKHSDLYATACPGRYFPYDELIKEEPAKIYSVNDILWQLMHDGIVTEADKWKAKMQDDTDVYWLCYKTANKLRGTL